VRILTSNVQAQSCGLVNVAFDNLDVRKVVDHLWTKHRIVVTTAGVEGQYRGLRVTPNIYTTLEEIDTFAAAIESLVRTGLPKETA
jgi:isopenicillin-N epimerase